jgi:hypothetical protein
MATSHGGEGKIWSALDCPAGHRKEKVRPLASVRNIGWKFAEVDWVMTCHGLTGTSLGSWKQQFLIQAREMMSSHILEMSWTVQVDDRDDINDQKPIQRNSIVDPFHGQRRCRRFSAFFPRIYYRNH